MRKRALAPLLVALGTGAACAQDAASSPWSARAEVLHRTLRERDDAGRRLVTESGPLLRLALDLQWPLAHGAALRGSAEVAAGTLDYDGQDQGGTPLTTRSRQRELALAGAWRPFAPAPWGEAWLTLRVLSQRRDIASTPAVGGLRETSTLWMPGVRWTRGFEAAGWRWQPSAELRASVHHHVDVDFHGALDDASFRGGRRWEAELALDASSAGSPWVWGVAWTHARQHASDPAALANAGFVIGTVRQPRIGIDDVALRVRRAF